MNSLTQNEAFAIYNCETQTFFYPDVLRERFHANFDDRPLWQIIEEDHVVPKVSAQRLKLTLEQLSLIEEPTLVADTVLGVSYAGDYKRYHVSLTVTVPKKQILVGIACEATAYSIGRGGALTGELDDLTGLWSRKAFLLHLSYQLTQPPMRENTQLAVVHLDIHQFKLINDIFSPAEGDRLLWFVAATLKKGGVTAARLDADRFAYFVEVDSAEQLEKQVLKFITEIENYHLAFNVICTAGAYIIEEKALAPEQILNYAIMAQATIKHSFEKKYALYDSVLHSTLLGEREIVSSMRYALKTNQFVVYYQPQFNHSTGMLVGAEALVRWNHPEKGLILPQAFISIFEKHNFISALDLFVFEQVCAFLEKSIDNRLYVAPIFVNLSRQDFFKPDFILQMEKIRRHYGIPAKFLRLELTESFFLGDNNFINNAVSQLHQYGYLVALDGFGHGHSSLNMLNEVPFDLIKLETQFLKSMNDKGKRGGTILSNIVRMLNWLQLPMIAEGVETREQADFLRSIGCDCLQGSLYAAPMSEADYILLLTECRGERPLKLEQVSGETSDFWSSHSPESLIFNSLVGPAAVFSYDGKNIELQRVNRKYLIEIGMNASESELLRNDPLYFMDDANQSIMRRTLERAILSKQEEECETWRNFKSSCCGDDRLCIRTTLRLINGNRGFYLFYGTIRNISSEKKCIEELKNGERQFRAAFEQINIYMWDFNLLTRDMRPCYRCMRDLGLPSIVKNYPEPLIESGLIPEDYADIYRNYMRKIEAGVPKLEFVMPLTSGRIPFRFRYTTEFDDLGRPIKAFGSATRVVLNE